MYMSRSGRAQGKRINAGGVTTTGTGSHVRHSLSRPARATHQGQKVNGVDLQRGKG